MKILYYSAAEEIGGAEIYLEQLIQGLDSQRFHITLLASATPKIEPWLVRLQPRLDRIIKTEAGKFHQPGFLKRLVNYFNQADVLHLNLGNPVGYKSALLAARLSRTKRQVATIHLAGTYPQPESIKQVVSRKALKFFYKSIDSIITVSEANRKQLTNYFELFRDKIHVIHNGVQVDKYIMDENPEKSRILLNFPIQKKLVVVVGRLHEQKGHSYLIHAARKIIDTLPACHFVFVGDGELRDSLQKEIGQLGLNDYFTFSGFRTDIPRILNAIDLFVLPSLDEGLPLVLLEAMAAGKPVIATNVGGVAELVQNNQTGIIIQPGRVDEIASAIINLLKSDKQMKMFGNQAHEYVLQNFSQEMMQKKTYENYE